MSWVYEHCQNLHVIRIHTHHLFPKRKGSLHVGQQFTTAKWAYMCLGLVDNLLMSGLGTALAHFTHPTVRVQVTQTGHPHDGALVKELHLNCLGPVCDSSHLSISWDVNFFFFISLLIYMPLMSHFHGASFLSTAGLSVPCAWNVTQNHHSPALPDYTALRCAPQPDLIQNTQQGKGQGHPRDTSAAGQCC